MIRLLIGRAHKIVIVTNIPSFQALCIVEIVHRCTASGAEYKVLKTAVGIFGSSPLRLCKHFLSFFPCLHIHKRRMCIFKNHLLLNWITDPFGFIRGQIRFEIDHHPQILAPVQKTDNRWPLPVTVSRFFLSGMASVAHAYAAKICSWRNTLLGLQRFGNAMWIDACCCQLKNSLHNGCCFRLNNPMVFIVWVSRIAKWRRRGQRPS